MPKFPDVEKVLILGSGAIKIGEAGEFDYSGAQAIKALKEEGVEVVLVNPNIATIQTDSKFVGDKAYFLPVTPDYVEDVIDKEGPDGVLLGFGGQTALNCGIELAESGVFERNGVKVLGTSAEAIERADDRGLFRDTMLNSGIPIPRSMKANTVEEAAEAAKDIGYPVMVRVAYTLGGQGTGVAKNTEELEGIAARGIAHSRISQVLVEEYVGGWKEIEYEVLRDYNDQCMIVCSMENFDPMGIHTGDSIVVAPSQTVDEELYSELKSTSFEVLRSLDLVGECNIQFAVHPETEEYKVIEVNSRLSRSSALASKATGYPIAYVTAKLSLGYGLDEIDNKNGEPVAAMEPDIDYIVVKMPRWDFQKFKDVDRHLGTQMKSVGEVMSIGKTFEEAVQKAVRMLNLGRELTDKHHSNEDIHKIKEELKNPTDERIYYIVEALRRGFSVDEVHELTEITPYFIECLKNIVSFEATLSEGTITPDFLRRGKELGYSDAMIGEHLGVEGENIRAIREKMGIQPALKRIKTAKKWSEDAYYLYMTYNDDEDLQLLDKHSVLVIGSGCYRIGSSVEFDWSCVNMSWSLKKKGYEEVIMANCNPETVSTDFDVLDKLYFEELTLERILDIVDKEKPHGVVTCVGGQIPNNLAIKLYENGVNILGTSALDIDRAEDRSKFSAILDGLGVKQPRWVKADTVEEAVEFAENVGYPVLVRPSYVLSGSAMNVAKSMGELISYLEQASAVSEEHPVVISKFIEGAMEVEVDGVANEGSLFIGALIEHIEEAGVHSGDATMVIPANGVKPEVKDKVKAYTKEITEALNIRGPFNIQFLVKGSDVYVIECNLRSSRSMPFTSKITGTNLMEIAAAAITGEKIPVGEAQPTGYGVKAPQFSFMRLQGVDPLKDVEMVSTGEVACLGENFQEALIKALEASGTRLPEEGENILMSIGQEKDEATEIARKLMKNYKIYATNHTAEALMESGVPCKKVYKDSEGKNPNVISMINKNHLKLIINTSSPNTNVASGVSDGYLIRRNAVDFGIPLITDLKLANSLAGGLKIKNTIPIK